MLPHVYLDRLVCFCVVGHTTFKLNKKLGQFSDHSTSKIYTDLLFKWEGFELRSTNAMVHRFSESGTRSVLQWNKRTKSSRTAVTSTAMISTLDFWSAISNETQQQYYGIIAGKNVTSSEKNKWMELELEDHQMIFEVDQMTRRVTFRWYELRRKIDSRPRQSTENENCCFYYTTRHN